jgi:hypothetical protein
MNWKARARLVSVAAVMTLGLATAAQAQPPGGGPPGFGRGGFGRGFGMFGGMPMSVVNVPPDVLEKELKLSAEQKNRIVAVQQKSRDEMRSLFPPPGGGGAPPDFQAMGERMREINESATKDIEATLSDSQKKQLPGMLKSLQNLMTLGIPIQVKSDLKLTDAQSKKLEALAAQVQKERQAKMQEMQAAFQSGDREKAREIMQSMGGRFGQPNDKAMALLNANQQGIVKKWIKDNPPRPGGFGRPGGPGGFGGPGGPPPNT